MNHRAWMLLIAVALVGCDNRPGPIELSTDADVQALGELPGLRATADTRLLDELARIEQQGGTPKLLRREVPDEENVWKGLERLYFPEFRQSNAEKTTEIFKRLYFRRREGDRYLVIDPKVLAEAARFREAKQERQEAAWHALDRPQCDFGLDPMMGLMADLTFIDTVRVCAHLEAFLAADFLVLGGAAGDVSADQEDLAQGPPRKATAQENPIESFEMMLRLADLLAQQKHLATRKSGAIVREDAWVVLRAIVDHPKTTLDDLAKLYQIVEKQLTAWPADADVWIGDRALGMHSYELVRGGHLDLLVGKEQLAQFDRDGVSADLPTAVMEHIDEDELFYLQTMRKIIAACRTPAAKRTAATFEARRKVLADMQQQLNRRRYDVQTLVACRVLLPEIRPSMARLAEDRAACEAWALALAEASGQPRPKLVPRLNPVDGSEYKMRTETDGKQAVVVVWRTGEGIGGAKQPVLVPMPIKRASATGE
ncbi:MAG: hypothetical protein IIA67_05635 [Planctomycetes bacterium]|nr:hypothetical protein [Planctomycetota bacterium]